MTNNLSNDPAADSKCPICELINLNELSMRDKTYINNVLWKIKLNHRHFFNNNQKGIKANMNQKKIAIRSPKSKLLNLTIHSTCEKGETKCFLSELGSNKPLSQTNNLEMWQEIYYRIVSYSQLKEENKQLIESIKEEKIFTKQAWETIREIKDVLNRHEIDANNDCDYTNAMVADAIQQLCAKIDNLKILTSKVCTDFDVKAKKAKRGLVRQAYRSARRAIKNIFNQL